MNGGSSVAYRRLHLGAVSVLVINTLNVGEYTDTTGTIWSLVLSICVIGGLYAIMLMLLSYRGICSWCGVKQNWEDAIGNWAETLILILALGLMALTLAR